MAVKKASKSTTVSMPAPKPKGELWATVGWALLLLGGLAHMLPEQMAPLLKWSMYGVSLQMVVGVVSVVLALYYLLGERPEIELDLVLWRRIIQSRKPLAGTGFCRSFRACRGVLSPETGNFQALIWQRWII